jgi:hypothetical protein
LRSKEDAVSKVEWVALCLGGSLAVFLLTFITKLFSVPKQLEIESVGELRTGHDALKAKVSALEEQSSQQKAEIERLKRSDPQNFVRHALSSFVERFQLIESKAARGEPIAADDLYPLEQEADQYINTSCPHYRDFTKDFPLITGWGVGKTLTKDEAIQRCRARIGRLKKALEILG